MAGWRDAVIAGQAAALVAMLAITSNMVLRDRDNLEKAIKSLQESDSQIAKKIDEALCKESDKVDKLTQAVGDTRSRLDALTDTVMWIARTSYQDRIKQLRDFPSLINKIPTKEK